MVRGRPRSTDFPYTTLFRSLLMGAPLSAVGLLAAASSAQASLDPGAATTDVPVSSGQEFAGVALVPPAPVPDGAAGRPPEDRKSKRLNSSHANISYAVFCLN